MSAFSDKIRALREHKGWTQQRLATELGLSHSYVHQLEAGKREPSGALKKLIELTERLAEIDSRLAEEQSQQGKKGRVREDERGAYNAAGETELCRRSRYVEREGTETEKEIFRRLVGSYYEYVRERRELEKPLDAVDVFLLSGATIEAEPTKTETPSPTE